MELCLLTGICCSNRECEGCWPTLTCYCNARQCGWTWISSFLPCSLLMQMWGYCPASVTISLGSQPIFAWKRLLLVLSLHWAPAGLAVTGLIWADEYGAGLLPEITTSSRFKALLRLYFLTDQLNVAYEICASMDLVFTKLLGGGFFIKGFMPWVNEALTWEAVLKVWVT